MKDYEFISRVSLGTYSSEKIGIQYYYLCAINIEERPVYFCIMFDNQDIAESMIDDEDEITEDMIENYAMDIAFCQAEVIASNEDYIEVADKTIEHYNNGARFGIPTNTQLDECLDVIREQVNEFELFHTTKKMADERIPMLVANEPFFCECCDIVDEYMDERDLFYTEDYADLLDRI